MLQTSLLKNNLPLSFLFFKKISSFLFFIFLYNFVFAQAKAFIPNKDFDSLKMMFVGDIMQSNNQIYTAEREDGKYYDYSKCFRYIQPILGLGDIVIGNLETNFAGKPYSGYPNYSAPDEFATGIRNAGINCLMTANDHCADKDIEGIKRTNKILDSVGIVHTGTFNSYTDRSNRNPLMIERYGFLIAVLNYTSFTRFSIKDSLLINVIDKERIKEDLAYTKKFNPDFTIIYFSWGREYQFYPDADQRELAKYCIDLGANMIIGTHPHVVQRVEQIEFYSGNKLKKGFVAFSLGNFITDYDRRFGDGGAILEVNLSKNKTTSEVKLAEYSFIPTYIIKEDGNGNKVQNVVPISEIETDNIKIEMSARERERCLMSGRDTRSMMSGFGNMEARYPISDDIVNDVAETIVLSGGPVNYDKYNKENKALDNFFLIQNLEEEETEEDTITTLATLANTTTTNNKTYTKINNTQTTTTKASNNYTENDIEEFEKKFRSIGKITYKIRFYQMKTRVEINTNFYTYLLGYKIVPEDGAWTYYIGEKESFSEAKQQLLQLRSKGVKNLKIIPFVNGKKIDWVFNV
jgi:poly-gamma-glutamate synthesis protein (capsule biosynthesis protein)